jgi:hypothetical protein
LVELPAATIRPKSAWRVTSVEVLPNARLRLGFVDGTTGEVDMRAFLEGSKIVGTAFEPLRNPGLLARAARSLAHESSTRK